MNIIGRASAAALIIGSFAVSESAKAQEPAEIKIGIGIPLSPGQQGTSPGQLFKAAKTTDPTTALPPGKIFLQNKAADPTTALPPGQTFTNLGRSKKP